MAATASKAAAIPPDSGAARARPGLIGTALLDARGAWEAVDPDLCELLGRGEQQLMATPVAAVVNPDDLARERLRLEQLLAGGLLTYQSETRLLHGAGHAIWTLLAATAVGDADGTPRCLLQLQDITTRKRLELNGSGWPAADVDLDGGPALVAIKDLDGHYLRANARFQATFSVAEERLRGRTDEYLFPQSVAAALRAADREAVDAAPEPVECEETVPQAGGDRAVVTVRFALLAATGRPRGVCAVSVDPAARDAVAGQLASLLDQERAAREAARDARAELLEIERAAWSGANVARDQVLAQVCADGGALVIDTSAPAGPGQADVSAAAEAERERQLQHERDARAAAEDERDRLAAAAIARDEALQAADEARTTAEADRDRVRRDSSSRVAELEDERAGERAAREQAGTQRDRLHEQTQRAAAALEEQRRATAALEAELARARAATEGPAADLRAERETRQRAEAALDDARRTARARKARLEAQREAVTRLEAELARARTDSEARDGVLDATRRSKSLLEAALAEAREAERATRAELEAERATRAEVEAERDRLREAERAAGERVPLPALSPEPPAAPVAEPGEDETLATWRAEGQARLTWALAEATAPYEGAREALAVTGETLGWQAGACYSSDDPTGARCCAFWRDTDTDADELESASWQATFRSGKDVVGRVLATGEPVWIEDVSAIEGFTLGPAAAAAGLRTAVALPIVGQDEVIGVLEVFSVGQRRPNSRMLETLTAIGRQLGQFFVRAEAEFLRSRYGLVDR